MNELRFIGTTALLVCTSCCNCGRGGGVVFCFGLRMSDIPGAMNPEEMPGGVGVRTLLVETEEWVEEVEGDNWHGAFGADGADIGTVDGGKLGCGDLCFTRWICFGGVFFTSSISVGADWLTADLVRGQATLLETGVIVEFGIFAPGLTCTGPRGRGNMKPIGLRALMGWGSDSFSPKELYISEHDLHFPAFVSKEGILVADGWLTGVVFPRACWIEVLGGKGGCKELQTAVSEQLVFEAGRMIFSELFICAGRLASLIFGPAEEMPPLFCAGGRAREGLIKTEIPLGVAAVGNGCVKVVIVSLKTLWLKISQIFCARTSCVYVHNHTAVCCKFVSFIAMLT